MGCVLIFLCIVALFCQNMCGKLAKQMAEFVAAKDVDVWGVGWHEKLGTLFLYRPRILKEEKVVRL